MVRDELWQVFPEEFAAVDHFSGAHVKQIHRQHPVFVVIAEDVGIVAFGRGHALALLQLLDGRNQIAISRRALVLLAAAACSMRVCSERLRSVGRPSRNSFTSRTASW